MAGPSALTAACCSCREGRQDESLAQTCWEVALDEQEAFLLLRTAAPLAHHCTSPVCMSPPAAAGRAVQHGPGAGSRITPADVPRFMCRGTKLLAATPRAPKETRLEGPAPTPVLAATH